MPTTHACVRLIVAAFAMSALSTAVAAQESGQVTGVVNDPNGNPLAGVTIVLGGSSTRDARSGSDGRFVVDAVPAGRYDLTATLEGFGPATAKVLVLGGLVPPVTITMFIRTLEQVTVQAERSGERDLQVVPLAVSALSDDELKKVEAHTIEDLAGMAPSVTFAQNTGFSQLTIRGTGKDLVTNLIQCLAEYRIRVVDFRTVVPTLEDVFLKLTGHAIRD